ARAGCLKVSAAVAPMRLAAILLLILLLMLLPMLLPILLPILLLILGPRLSLLVAAMLLPTPSPLLWSTLSPLLAPGLSSLLASMLSRRLSSLPASKLSSMLSSLPASRLSSTLSWSLAPMRRRPQNRKSRQRGLRPPRAENVAPTPDPDKSPCKQMHGREIWFRYARARTIRSSASGIMMPMVGGGLISSGAGGLEGLIEAQT